LGPGLAGVFFLIIFCFSHTIGIPESFYYQIITLKIDVVPMTNLSTLLFLVNIESGIEEIGKLSEEINLMEEFESDMLVSAPESALKNILGFASSYTSMQSILLDEIEVYKN
jgi:hypothetical protein